MSEKKRQAPEKENNESKPRAPWVRLASAYYQFDIGEHPNLASNDLFTFNPILDSLIEDHLSEYDLPIIPCIDGHNVMITNGIASMLNTDVKVPLSPNFVRDIAGRIIYTGYGPEKKKSDQWQNNRHVTFPQNCRVVTTDIEGNEYIENIFFTRFRTLDASTKYENNVNQLLCSYAGENLYPYKLRLDTFYQDGWKLPQTNMLYARNSVNPAQAKNVGLKFVEEWNKVKEFKSYNEFIEENGGKSWIEKLFQAGCTVIPTTEAYNSYYVVKDNYGIKTRRAGRSIEGLHDVTSTKASEEPKGTILEVLSPGFITATHIHKAEVITSNGERYLASKKAFPLAEYPDLRLPHQRTQSVWKSTWIPTHPTHFEEPSIWGWDMATGHFLQLTGPLWDPLHYYYESNPLVVKAFKNRSKQSKNISFVPQEMKERFYPVSAIKGFDMISFAIKKMRQEKNVLPKSALLRVTDNKFSSNVGYHPLPYAFEYELSHLWFPELMPTTRTPRKPSNINLSPVVTVNTTPKEYHGNTADMNEFDRLKIDGVLQNNSFETLTNYPHLHRYLSDFSLETMNAYGRILINTSDEPVESLSEIYVGTDMTDIIEATGMPFYKAAQSFKEKSMRNLNRIIDAYTSDIMSFTQKYWKGR